MTSPGVHPHFLDDSRLSACIHCGLCLASCPTYLESGNENDSPRGRIYLMRALQDGRAELAPAAVRHIDLCLGCRACEAACPSGVQYGHLLEHTREHVARHFRRSPFQSFLRRVAIEGVFPFPTRLRRALASARLARALRLEAFLPKFARGALALVPGATPEVALPDFSPALPSFSSGAGLQSGPGPSGTGAGADRPRGRVGFVSGCVMSVLFGETNASSVRLLNLAGYDVVVPPAQGCCGALYAHGGSLERARRSARSLIEIFERQELDAIVINAAGCGSTLKEYGQLLANDPAWAGRARVFAGKIRDLTEFLAGSGLAPILSAGSNRSRAGAAPGSGPRITFHDACHLAHPQRITRQPRELVRSVAGDRFVELPESDVCCGSAGSYNLTEPGMAARLQRRKTDCILKTGARVVVTTNPGCILQIRAGLKDTGVEVLHIADFLLRELGRGTS